MELKKKENEYKRIFRRTTNIVATCLLRRMKNIPTKYQ